MAFRLDKGRLVKTQTRRDGSIVTTGTLTRSGVFLYQNPDGTVRREYRPPEEVFAPASMESFAMVPITNGHPPALITTEDAKAYTVGSTGSNVSREDQEMISDLAIFDAGTIKDINNGKVELSCGYDCDIDETPGVTPEGEKYDAVQKNIIGNHVAVVQRGRAGTARLRLDSADAVSADFFEEKKNQMDPEQVQKILEQNAALLVEKSQMAARIDALEADLEAANEAKEKAEQARTDAESVDIDALVEAALKVRTDAALILAKDYEYAGKGPAQIRLDAIDKAGVQLSEAQRKDGAYVSARFDALVDAAKTAPTQPVEADIGGVRKDSVSNKPTVFDSWKEEAEKFAASLR